jgi:isopropylmalate/homocitrate/citramalate synthase
MGWGVPYPRASLPAGIPKLISIILEETGAELEFHGHNDFGMATANSIAAWVYGCARVNATFAGMGERTGNTSLEQMVAALIRFFGDPGLDLHVLSEMATMISEQARRISSRAPVIGQAIFTTQAGLHQNGVERHGEAPGGLIYLPYSPSFVGRQEVELHRIGGLAGMEGLVAVLNDELEARGDPARYTVVSKIVKQVYDQVHAAYDGTWDEEKKAYVEPRTTFFEPQEILQMADEAERESENDGSP